MKLRPTMRSKLAEKICQQWIRQRRIRLAKPAVYVIWRQGHTANSVHGWWHRGRNAGSSAITLHLGVKSDYRDWIILLAHEFAHHLHHWTTGQRWLRRQSHGERFQILFWNTLSRAQWHRASTGHWAQGPSAHRQEFQP